MKRHVSCAAILMAFLALGSVSAQDHKPNIIVFLVDDMGVMDTSVPFLTDKHGKPVKHPLNKFFRTPGMARLAENGIRFSQFYAQSVCSPSRASLMTGQNATRHQTTTWISPLRNNKGDSGPPKWNWSGLKKSDVTLPRELQKAGYRTIHIGKGHFGPKGSEGSDPTNLGFDVNIAGCSWGRPKSYFSENHYGNHPKYKKSRVTHNIPHLGKYHDTGIFLTEALTLEAKDQVRQSVKAKVPFFLYLSHYAVHGPFDRDPRFFKNYKGRSAHARAFAALIEGMDKSLNDMLDLVEELGIDKHTLVLFLGDNGTAAPMGHKHAVACAAPLRGMKGTHYEGGTRVPFIAAWVKPDRTMPCQQRLPIAEGAIQSQVGTIMDIFPTLLELVGCAKPADHIIDGYSLRKLFAGQRDPAKPERFLMHFPHDHLSSYFTSYRVGDWKLVYHYNPGKTLSRQLFNLAKDPYEQNDLAKTNPQKLQAMTRSMATQLEEEGALYPEYKGKALKPAVTEM